MSYRKSKRLKRSRSRRRTRRGGRTIYDTPPPFPPQLRRATPDNQDIRADDLGPPPPFPPRLIRGTPTPDLTIRDRNDDIIYDPDDIGPPPPLPPQLRRATPDNQDIRADDLGPPPPLPPQLRRAGYRKR
jgi:hypothetical protein